MAGPTCSILTPTSVSLDDVAHELMRRISHGGEYCLEFSCWDFHVIDTRPIGGAYYGESRPFLLSDEYEHRDPADAMAISGALNWPPPRFWEIGISAMCNGNEDHRILGEIALWLAEQFPGVIALGGYPYGMPPDFAQQVTRVPYVSSYHEELETELLDPITMRAWLDHPKFRMVK